MHHAETWVAVAFVLFVGLGIYLKVPAMLAKMLDERADKISKELAEAQEAPRGSPGASRRVPEEARRSRKGRRQYRGPGQGGS